FGWSGLPADLLAGVLTPHPQAPEGERRPGEDDHRRPDVEAEPEEVVGLVYAHHLDDAPTGGVQHQVEGEDLALGKVEAAVDQHEGQGDEQAPQRLVEKGRL